MSRFAAIALIMATTAIGLGVWAFVELKTEPVAAPAAARASAGLPPISDSPFLNTSSSAEFVGVQTCAQCHPAEYDSYLETAHSLALSEVDLDGEPPDGSFSDERSGRHYDVSRRDGRMWHREWLPNGDGQDLVLADFPMRYAIGSGRFTRGYLADRDGFLVESPATWYAARPGWAISPGYEKHNPGFERPIVRECLNCHVGRADVVAGTLQRFAIHSQTIDCERCHGPGSLHEERWSNETAISQLPSATSHQPTADRQSPDHDLTIVHPGRLSRGDAEAICAQCHLHSEATVELRGRRLSDFRPGMKLVDFCIHYGMKTPGNDMKVVGHVEQMRLSACYRGSDTLTCTTCHDPHDETPVERRRAAFRDKCVACHQEDACGLTPAERAAQVSDDDCMTCHMPTSPTDIPHSAFTHHRIGIHREEAAEEAPRASELVPLEDVSHLPQIEQDRCLGLAYIHVSSTAQSSDDAAGYRRRGQSLLESVRERGLQDPEVDAALARLNWRVDPARTVELAQSVLSDDRATPESRVTALFTLGSTYADQNQPEQAAEILEELVQARLYSEDWYILSRCYDQLGDVDRAVQAAERAAQISPQYPQLQQHLARLAEKQGDKLRAQQHLRRADRLAKAQSLTGQPNAE